MGVGVCVASGVVVAVGGGIGAGVSVGSGVAVGGGTGVGAGVAVGLSLSTSRATRASTVDSMAASASTVAITPASTVSLTADSASAVPRMPASTVAGMLGAGSSFSPPQPMAASITARMTKVKIVAIRAFICPSFAIVSLTALPSARCATSVGLDRQLLPKGGASPLEPSDVEYSKERGPLSTPAPVPHLPDKSRAQKPASLDPVGPK